MRPIAVARVHVVARGRASPRAQAWTAPRTAPVTRPPASAAARSSTGPVRRKATAPPSGKPAKETIQRRTVAPSGPRGYDGGRAGRGAEVCHDVLLFRVCGWSGVVARDPGREQVVGVLGQVVPHECVEEVLVAAETGVGERHELTVPDRGRVPARAGEDVGVRGEQRRRHEQRR